METKKTKKTFTLPHLLVLLLGLMFAMSIMTYILPAGQFVEATEGVKEYVRVDRTPVNPLKMFLYIYEGVANSGGIIALLLTIGGNVSVVLSTKALDRLVDFSIYKLQDKGSSVLIPAMFMIMVILGGFGGTDALIAVIPIGVLVAKKLRLDPVVAAGSTLLATMIGFSTSPTGLYLPQSLMDVPIYSGFGMRLLNMALCGIIGAVYLTIYAKRVEKNAARSALGHTEWLADLGDNNVALEKQKLNPRDLLITVLFIGQFPVAIVLNLKLGFGLAALPAVMVPMAVICGLIHGMKLNEIGKKFEEGACGMGFICLIIGLAGGISLVMKNGKILDTIAYYASLPLQNLGSGFAAIGISVVITGLNFIIPSASAKAAALMPIVKPMAETLGITAQIAVQAFQIGDGFCNLISPFLGWTMGGLAIANVPYQKWVKWVLPLIVILLLVEYAFLMFLTGIGWTGI